jgi:hypothetical protein
LHNLGSSLQGSPEHRLAPVKLPPHLWLLRALSAKEKGNLRSTLFGEPSANYPTLRNPIGELFKLLLQALKRFAHQGQPVIEMGATGIRTKTQVPNRCLRMLSYNACSHGFVF